MAKYGTFKYGSGQRYGTSSNAGGAEVAVTNIPNGDRIIEGSPAYINGVFSLSDKFFYVGDTQSISTTYLPENIQYANYESAKLIGLYDAGEIVTSGVSSSISLVQAIGNPIVINNAGARFSR